MRAAALFADMAASIVPWRAYMECKRRRWRSLVSNLVTVSPSNVMLVVYEAFALTCLGRGLTLEVGRWRCTLSLLLTACISLT